MERAWQSLKVSRRDLLSPDCEFNADKHGDFRFHFYDSDAHDANILSFDAECYGDFTGYGDLSIDADLCCYDDFGVDDDLDFGVYGYVVD